MNILVLADAHVRDNRGGSRVVANEINERLAKRGHKVICLVAMKDKSLPEWEEINGVIVQRYSSTGFLSSKKPNVLAIIINGRRAVRNIFKNQKIDLVISHFAYADIGHLFSGFTSKTPFIRWFYGPWADESKVETDKGTPSLKWRFAYLLKHLIEYISLIRSDRIVVLSNYSANQLKYYKINSQRIIKIPGGVDTDRFKLPQMDKSLLRCELGLPEKSRILFTVRRLVRRMGLENLIKAFVLLSQDNPDLLLVIGGQGRLKRELVDLTLQLKIENKVYFTGFIPDERLTQYYQAADLFVLPTVALEGFGMIIVEALACGLPVLGTPIGAIPELLVPLNKSLLFSGEKPENIEQGLRQALNGQISLPSSIESHLYIELNYSWDKVINQIEDLFSQLES